MTPEVAAWFALWWPIWSPLALLLLGSASAGVWAIVTRRGGEKAARRNPLPPTWPEMWARLDAQDQKMDRQDAEIAELKRMLGVEQREKAEIIRHVKTLEAGYPNPPGPPPRPWVTVS